MPSLLQKAIARCGEKYGPEVAELAEDPELVVGHWDDMGEYGGLFAYVTPSGKYVPEKNCCGCLTQVFSGDADAWTEELTTRIREDERLHGDPDDIQYDLESTDSYDERIDILAPYAEWQMKLDQEIRS